MKKAKELLAEDLVITQAEYEARILQLEYIHEQELNRAYKQAEFELRGVLCGWVITIALLVATTYFNIDIKL